MVNRRVFPPSAPPISDYYELGPPHPSEHIYQQIPPRNQPPAYHVPQKFAFLPPSSPPPSYSSPISHSSPNPVERSPARFEIPPKRAIKRRFNPISLTHRRCTDVCCCFLFLAFLVGWGFIAVLGRVPVLRRHNRLAFIWGKPERLIHPTDSRGRICGYNRPGAYDFRLTD